MRWLSLSTLSSLAAAQPDSSVQQLIQLNYTYFIFAFVKLKDKHYNFKIGYNFVKYFFKPNLYVGRIMRLK